MLWEAPGGPWIPFPHPAPLDSLGRAWRLASTASASVREGQRVNRMMFVTWGAGRPSGMIGVSGSFLTTGCRH